MKKILHVVGARPNFMKLAPVYNALKQYSHIEQITVHTGQHYDFEMFGAMLRDLDLPTPTYDLEINREAEIHRLASMISGIGKTIEVNPPDLVVVYGDVDSTLAGGIAAGKMGVPVAHVEAGLRSHDWDMPEEFNRVLVDEISSLLFCPCKYSFHFLQNAFIRSEAGIHMVGNVMIDSLLKVIGRTKRPKAFENLDRYAVVTMHRPSNIKNVGNFIGLVEAIEYLAECMPVIFPMHPRTRKEVDRLYGTRMQNVDLVNALGYCDFIGLLRDATIVITDSGGVQEETTFLKIPCLTIRSNTERPITVTDGTNVTVGIKRDVVIHAIENFLQGRLGFPAKTPELWDGHAGERIAKIIDEYLTDK